MIFAQIHIEKILNHSKVMTRRSVKPRDHPWDCRYQKYHTYAVQPGRGKKAVARIEVIATPHQEYKLMGRGFPISVKDAELEGGYTPKEYEELFEKLYPGWSSRWVIYFKLSDGDSEFSKKPEA